MNGADRPDFAELYDSCFAKVYNYVRYRLADAAAADDVVSRVFEQAFERFERFDPALGSAEAWLIGIARNAVNDHFRTGARRGWIPLESVEPAPVPPSAGRADDLRELLGAIERLEDRAREILGLKFGAGMTNRDIAAHLGLSESNVGIIVYRAVKKLQEALKP